MTGKSRQHPRGYVLVVTLALLVLSSTLLVAVGRVAVRHAAEAHEAQDDLQRHWGAVSCRNAVLPFAEQILSQAEATQHRPVPVYRANVQLGNQAFSLIVSDEQAKANVNDMIEIAAGNKTSAESALRESFAGPGLSNSIRLRLSTRAPGPGMIVAKTQPSTTQPTGAVSGVPAWVSGLGQIFDNVPPQRLLGVTGPMVPIDRVTCWGAGGTNIMRASSEAMKLAAGSMMSTLDIGRVIEARNARFRPASAFGSSSNGPALAGAAANATGSDGVGRFLTEAKVTVKNRAKLPLVAGSSCHSVWIVVGDGRRAWYYLVVSDESNPQKPRTQSFVW